MFLFIVIIPAEPLRFCANTDWYLEQFIIPSTFTRAPVQLKIDDAASTTLHCGSGVLFVMCSVVFAQKIPFGIMAKKFNLGLIRP